MLHIRFHSPVLSDEALPAPVPEVIVSGERLLAGGKEVATHHNNSWHHAGRVFTVVLVEGACRVRFESAGAPAPAEYGPYSGVKVVDGSIRFGPEYREMVARLDEANERWVLYSGPGAWDRAVIVPA